MSALASHGLRPTRLDMYIHSGVLYVSASHVLPFGRWLNVNIVAPKSSTGFPPTSARIGSVSFPPAISRPLFEIARWSLAAGGANVPPLDALVQDFSIEKDTIVAKVHQTAPCTMLDQFAAQADRVDPNLVSQIYCRLADAQTSDPTPDFAVQLNRAFPAERAAGATSASNRAAFVALAMFIVDKRAGMLANLNEAQMNKCAAPNVPVTLHQRSDLPKHWALSAAIASQASDQLTNAIGEWKELSDSLPADAEFQTGNGSGFSFVDIAADRSGSRIARAAISGPNAAAMARRLSEATQAQILPPPLLKYPEGMTDTEFGTAFGDVDDPKYLKMVSEIDDVITRDGLLAGLDSASPP